MLQVSVVIPAHNAVQFIGRAVSSVLQQSHPARELVVVDDGSEDDLEGALAPFRTRLTLVRCARRGVAHARNIGIEATGGDCVAFLDADDYWEPTKLTRQVEVLSRHPEVGVVSGGFFVEGGVPATRRPVPFDSRIPLDRPIPPRSRDLVTLVRRMLTTTFLVRRRDLGRDRFDETLKTAEDRDLYIRLLVRCSSYLLSEPLATKTVRSDSLSEADPRSDYPNMLAVIEKNAPLLGRREAERWTADVLLGWARAHLGRHEFAEAFSIAVRGARRAPVPPAAIWTLVKAGVLWVAALGRGRSTSARPNGKTG